MLTTGLIILGSVVLLVWVSRHVELSRVLREDVFLHADPAAVPPEPVPLVSVLIPARNEAGNIGRALDSVLTQNYPRLEILVGDDRSDDDTAKIVRDFADRDPRIRLLQNRELPEGWTGKSHILWKLSREARGEILLLLDADVTLDPGAVTVMTRHLLDSPIDALSMLIRLESTGFWEKTTRVLLGAVLMLRYPLKKVNDPKSSLAFANGQVIMIRAACYRAIGGHRSVRSALLEDMALARSVKQHACRLAVVYGFDVASTRMYHSLGELCRGWCRILHTALRGRLVMLGLAVTMLLIFSFSPYAALVSAGVRMLVSRADAGTLVLLGLSVLELTAMLSLLWRLHRMSRCEGAYVALNLVAVLTVLGILFSAVVKRFSSAGIVWKGTRYDARQGTL